MDPIETLKEKIKTARKDHDHTQKSLASHLGMSLRTYQRIEKGDSPIELAFIYKFCEFLKIDIIEFSDFSKFRVSTGNAEGLKPHHGNPHVH